MKTLLCVALVLCSSVLQGCSTGSAIAVGAKRAKVPADSVQVYLDAPKSFEVVGLVEATATGMTSQGEIDNGIAKLKREAGGIGANGILLESGTGAAVKDVSVWGSYKQLKAKAIFVTVK